MSLYTSDISALKRTIKSRLLRANTERKWLGLPIVGSTSLRVDVSERGILSEAEVVTSIERQERERLEGREERRRERHSYLLLDIPLPSPKRPGPPLAYAYLTAEQLAKKKMEQ